MSHNVVSWGHLLHKHRQKVTGAACACGSSDFLNVLVAPVTFCMCLWRGGDGAVVPQAVPGNVVHARMEWKKDGRLLCAFHHGEPTASTGSPWMSASGPIPSSLIPFSQNVIGKKPIGLPIACSLPVWAQQGSKSSGGLGASAQSAASLLVSVVLEVRKPMCRRFLLSVALVWL